jgi:glycosyltransferase involved in cell wall biosynthesis
VTIPVSVVVMTKNEEANIAACLSTLQDFAEVFVVDSRSTDETPSLAQALGARVVEFDWNGRYPKKKQWALENLPFSHDWVLYLDADEAIPTELADEIRDELQSGPRHAGYFVELDYRFLGRTLRHGQHVRKLILFDRACGHFAEYDDLDATNMWEVEGHYQPRVDGSVGELKTSLVHDDHDSLFHYFERHNRYSDWEAVVRAKGSPTNGTQRWPRPKAVFNALPFKPLAFFFHSYVIRLGFLDGRSGFHYALAKAFYYWQIRVKQIELAQEKR